MCRAAETGTPRVLPAGAQGVTLFEGLPDLSLQGSCNLELFKWIVCYLLSYSNLQRNTFQKEIYIYVYIYKLLNYNSPAVEYFF